MEKPRTVSKIINRDVPLRPPKNRNTQGFRHRRKRPAATCGHEKRGFLRIPLSPCPAAYFLQHSPSAFLSQSAFFSQQALSQSPFLSQHALSQSPFLSQQAVVASACPPQQASASSHFSVHPAQAEASVVAAAPSPAAFLFELPQQLTIATAAMTMTKEKIFFIT